MSRNTERGAFHSPKQGDTPVSHRPKAAPGDDFFTDSILETSKIPTPSPVKNGLHILPGSRSRRSIGNTRTLKAAWNATAKMSRASSSASETARPQLQPLKTSSTQAGKQMPASSHQAGWNSTTSSPKERPSYEIGSPASDASGPPGGLTDVYQRIADEEDLAAQEGLEDDDDNEDYTQESMPNGAYMGGDQAQVAHSRKTQSPVNLRDSRRSTPKPYPAEANKENHIQDDTEPSRASGMSFLDDLTDQALATKLTPHTIAHARDRARLEKALNKESPIAFSRAKIGSKASMSAEDLLRSDQLVDDNHTSNSLPESIATDTSDPPANVPRTWGSRAKVGKDWLHRIHGGNDSPTSASPNAQASNSSQVDWTAAAAEVPLPAQDDSSTPKAASSMTSTPVILNKKSSLDKIRHWELNDFTSQSLQVSNSPPVRVRTMVTDQNREKEIESLEKRAVATSRLGEIRRKDSREYLPKHPRSTSVSTTKGEGADLVLSPEKRKTVQFEDNGEPIPGTPIVVYKISTSDTKDDAGNFQEGKTQSEGRADSRENLQRLARAQSESPRPASSSEEWSLVGNEEGNVSGGEGYALRSEQRVPRQSDTSRKSSKQVTNVEVTPQGVKAPDFAKTPLVTGAWTDTILPDSVRTIRQEDKHLKYTQTPHVKPGGWIDTPHVHGRRQSSALAPIPVENMSDGPNDDVQEATTSVVHKEEGELGGVVSDKKLPELPRSALAGLLDKAKRKLASPESGNAKESNDTLNLGDATIESLEDLLTLDNADMTTLIRMGAEFEARDQHENSEGKNAGSEAELLERLGIKLERLRTNIHDARKGISKLEHQVSHPESSDPSHDKPLSLASPSPCEFCGCPRGTSIVSAADSTMPPKVYLTIPLPRLWHPLRRDLGHWLPRPTVLGWITLLLWTWYLSESTMCEIYCHPLYAEFYDWPDEPEPRWGWALPTMIWRWSRIREFGPLILGPLWTLAVALTRIVAQALGWSDGFVDSPWPAAGAAGGGGGGGGGGGLGSSISGSGSEQGTLNPVALNPKIPNPSWAPDLTMMNDEYL